MIYILSGICLLTVYNKFESKLTSFVSFLCVYIGVAFLIVGSLIMLIQTYTNMNLVSRYNYNACGIYHINDKIVEHRTFHDNLFYGIFYSEKVANLPLIRCHDGRIIETIPWNK